MKLKILVFLVHVFIITSLVIATTSSVGAQNKLNQTEMATTAVSDESTGSAEREATEGAKKSTYLLPYAGILPDHPLYFLKTVRDSIIDFLIADSLKKAEFTLLQADKSLSAGLALVDKGNPQLAFSTVQKGENQLFTSLKLTKKAQSEGKDASSQQKKLVAAFAKHEEVLRQLAQKTKDPVKEQFLGIAKEVSQKGQSF